jgi:hypothetical protein
MIPMMLLLLVVAAQDTDEARRAIAIVQKHEGKIAFDDKAPGRPVIGINL